tara:strand:- start:41 stop:286 length:246 start_codon:yes stop_codon:yes gene_type:complete
MTEYKNEVEKRKRELILEKKKDEWEDIYVHKGVMRVRYWNGSVEENGKIIEEPMSLERQWSKLEREEYYNELHKRRNTEHS